MKKTVVKSILLFAVAFAFSGIVATQVITLGQYLPATLFFLVLFVLVVWVQRDILRDVLKELRTSEALLWLAISIAAHISIRYVITTFLDRPDWPFSEQGVSFLMLNNYFVFAIPANILFQQTLIASLVLSLIKEKLSLLNVSSLLAVGFGLLHAFQTLRVGMVLGLLFTLGAIAMSFILPYMLVKKKYGFVYNLMIHLAIYDLAALLAYTIY